VIGRLVAVAGIVLVVALGVLVAYNWQDVRAFSGILPAFYAKEFCSCRFVVGQSVPFCHDYARQWLPINHFYLSEHKRCVTVTALGQTRSAGFLNRREGCRLDVC
jgi:hypothetical protein